MYYERKNVSAFLYPISSKASWIEAHVLPQSGVLLSSARLPFVLYRSDAAVYSSILKAFQIDICSIYTIATLLPEPMDLRESPSCPLSVAHVRVKTIHTMYLIDIRVNIAVTVARSLPPFALTHRRVTSVALSASISRIATSTPSSPHHRVYIANAKPYPKQIPRHILTEY